MNTLSFGFTAAGMHKTLRRAGLVGFWFFFIKGLLWLAAPLVFYYLV